MLLNDEKTPLDDNPTFNDCWNQIGVMGDRSCTQLKTVIHCHECPVYAAVGDSLLERPPIPDYLQEWIGILEETPATQNKRESNKAIIRTAEAVSIIIFRLGAERLGLPVRMLQEVTPPGIIQPIPHRSNNLFLGLVNIRGETLLCASLHYLLNIESADETSPSLQAKHRAHNAINRKRMIVAGQSQDKWVFPVDQIHGIFRFHPNELQQPPVVITKASEGYTKGIIYWEEDKVNYLDSDLLFYTLNHKIL